jgi:hypothetical protein
MPKFFLALLFGALASLIWFPLALVVFFVALLALIPVRGTCRYLREDRQTRGFRLLALRQVRRALRAPTCKAALGAKAW